MKSQRKRALQILSLLFIWSLSPASKVAADELKVGSDGKIKVAVAGYYGYATIGDLVADHVNLALGRSPRFEVHERSRLQDVMNEKQLAELFGNPREAVKLRGVVPVQYLVYGKILSASCPVNRSSTYDKKRKRYNISYTATASVSIAHRITEVASGKILEQTETTGSHTSYSSSEEPAIDPLVRAACVEAVKNFVKAFVPKDVQGSVTELLADGQVMINLGSADGVGTDVDLTFVREEPVLNAEGKPVLRDGQPVMIKKQFGPEKKPKDLCVARPVRVDKDFCIADVGYNSRGGFMGGTRFKKSLDHFSAVKVGDAVMLNARPEAVE